MGLVGGVARPAVEGVVERHAGLELLEVVGVHAREAEGGGEEAGRLRREVEAGGVGAADDGGEAVEGGMARPNSASMVSKEQRSPRWLQNTSSMS